MVVTFAALIIASGVSLGVAGFRRPPRKLSSSLPALQTASAADDPSRNGDCVTRGAFSRKSMHANEWRLTWWPCDVTGELPSKRFMNWGKQNAVPKYTATVPVGDHPPA